MLCNKAAQAGNKGGTWKVWLSSSSEDAASRFADVGPWAQEQSDGGLVLTFSSKTNLATTPQAALRYDEHGRVLSARSYWTGTQAGGLISTLNCANWTSASSTGTYGSVGYTTSAWTAFAEGACNSNYSLLCFEQTHSPLPPPPSTTHKRLFVTSMTYMGNFGGANAADALCNTAAQAGNKGGTWKAWLSVTYGSAAEGFAEVGPWYQEQGDGGMVLTFNNKANLSTRPLAALRYDEQGRILSSGNYWTGTSVLDVGTSSSDNCTNWTTSSATTGAYGSVGSTGAGWTTFGKAACDLYNSLLCFEQ